MSTDTPTLVHFFAWPTRISLELPVGFEEADVQPDANAAIYADDLDEDDPLGGRVLAKASTVGDEPEAFRRLAEAAASEPGRELVWRRELVVGGLPACLQQVTAPDPNLDVEVVRVELFAQAADVVFTIIGLAPAERADEYVPAYERAATTARFVLL